MTPPRADPVVLGIDLGTGSVKAAVVGLDGTVRKVRSAPYAVAAPRPGWAESDPGDWEDGVARAVRAVLQDGAVDVRAVGLSGQMHGVVLCGADRAPLRPAVLWADSRATAAVEGYGRLPSALRERLGNPVTPGMAGPVLCWLAAHEPEVSASARWALQPKDWLRLRLTGAAGTEPSDACATLLYDLPGDRWCDEVVDALGLRRDLLAPPGPSDGVAGGLTASGADLLGLPVDLPVVRGAADTAAAALGSDLAPGAAQLTIGTGAQVVSLLRGRERDPAGVTHRYRTTAPQGWYAMAAVQSAGLALDWAGRILGLDPAALHAAAATAPPGAGGLTFLPHLAGERTPHLDPHARGGWVGAGLQHGRATLARAALEGVAFAVREGLDALEASLGASEGATGTLRLAGGGSMDAGWRQILADVLGRPLAPVAGPASSVRGAALLARSAVEGAPPLAPLPPPRATVTPGQHEAYGPAYERFRAAYTALRAARAAPTSRDRGRPTPGLHWPAPHPLGPEDPPR